MSRHDRRPLGNLLFALGLAAAALGLLLATSQPGWTDDRDLLRFQASKPYLFILLDTSGSMNLAFGVPNDAPAVGHGDDPGSKIYAAKEALFSVFEPVDDVNFGFASFNQNEPRVIAKHFLYYVETIPGGWPAGLGWPVADPDGLTTFKVDLDTDGDGNADVPDPFPDNDVEGDVLVFGPAIPGLVNGAGEPTAGSCGSPLNLKDSRERQKVNAFPRPGGTTVTEIWFKTGPPGPSTTYRLRTRRLTAVESPGNPDIPSDGIRIRFELQQMSGACAPVGSATQANFVLRRDPVLNDFAMVDLGVPGNRSVGQAREWTAALWNWRDAVVESDTAGEPWGPTTNTCGSRSPFTGKGWEGNYDAGISIDGSSPGSGGTDFSWPEEGVDTDRFCAGGTCIPLKPMEPTILSSFGRALDRGDVLPFDWQNDNRLNFLQRLAPNWPEEPPHFGVTFHLASAPDATTGAFPPRTPEREPIVAAGDTPLAKAINDFRCWYMGAKGAGAPGKCGSSAFFDQDGWSTAGCQFDSEYGCRRPFLVIITDGDDVCAGENPTADVAAMNSATGVQTWVLNLGDPQNCTSGQLNSIVQSGGGQCVNVSNKQALRTTLQNILGIIREAARAFASAAVPSVQATADQAIYISQFTPLNNKSVWDGHLNAFLKPVPLTAQKTPDTSVTCGGATTDGCLLWDAGTVMEGQVNAADFLGNGENQRRVGYGQLPFLLQPADRVPMSRRLFDPIDCEDCDDSPTSNACQTCRDLLAALRIPEPADPTDESQWDAVELQANNVIQTTLALKSHDPDGAGPEPSFDYILGDIFHSNPTVVGTPVNVQYFALDLGADQDQTCKVDDSAASANRGYRCFLRRHRFRRKTILVGSNAGMLHAINAGFFDNGTGRYDNGTGHELWAYMPRSAMPRVRQLAEGTAHKFTVDGTPSIFDVFIDPRHDGPGSASPPAAAERLWRTVAVAGLREGGSGYYALDITQPDEIQGSDPDFLPQDPGVAVPGCLVNPANCPGPVPYPAPLWEFVDSTRDSLLTAPPTRPVPMDEDGNGVRDLGQTWSEPNLGRIRVCVGVDCDPTASPNDVEERYVAIFGGGLDPDEKTDPLRGDWLYMVDVETGKVLYKRRLVDPNDSSLSGGGAPSEPAAVDTNQDGFLDRIYIGTTGGFMYRVDMVPDGSGNLPRLVPLTKTALDGISYTTVRIQEQDGGGNPVWEPRVIFDANFDGGSALSEPRPIFHRPSVIFAAKLGKFGLAFGTGDREDLWNITGQEGRFYVFIDDTAELAPGDLPLTENDFQRILANDPDLSVDLLLTRAPGKKGWYLVLDSNERVITESFSLSGVTIFSSFQPSTVVTSDQDCDPLTQSCTEVVQACGNQQFESATDNFCARTGQSRIFVVGTVNANQFLQDAIGGKTRFDVVSTFVTNPFTEPGQSDTESARSGGGSDQLSQREIDIMNSLKSLFPANCKFANYRIDIKTIAADTSLERIASIPVCIIEKNWKEF